MTTRRMPGPEREITDEQYRGMYEAFYARAGDDFSSVPWASLAPHPALVGWLGTQPPPTPERRALVIGCGLGDDAEHAAATGYSVTAFDFSPTAIDLAPPSISRGGGFPPHPWTTASPTCSHCRRPGTAPSIW